jgi:TNF receptor-associated protein 1
MQVNLYSKKVLVKAKARELLPDYLRFVKGVVDCEDIPLNISREGYQDSSLITKLRILLTKRVLRLLDEEARKNPESYMKWYNDFQMFLKEGLASDSENVDDIMRLTRYEGNWTKDLVTMEDYIKSMKPGQNKIFYITGHTRAMAETSPYLECFEGTGDN